ncbi:MAG: sulfatase-like hydrolase/transferase [Candidatus Latescibacteria bacterium]|nr:sulfatase-like hydrolase/transferase [Candidatus Latescibacterota bacterium]
MPTRPNIVFLMPDQLRHDFLSCYGADFIDTPHIDALCQHGIRYQRAYSEHPVCVPARAALLTGMNAVKAGVLDNSQWLRPDYRDCGLNTWPEILKGQGYYTLATGKMHFYPWQARFGFDRRIIAEDKLWGFVEDDYHHFLAAQGYTKRAMIDQPAYHQHHMALVSPIPYECTVDHWVGVQTANWIEEYDGDQPYAIMVGFPGPHSQYDPAPQFATFDPATMPQPLPAVAEDVAMMRGNQPARAGRPRQSWYKVDNPDPPTQETHQLHRAYYAGLVKQIDIEVGRIVAALEKKGQLDNTIIILSSDHGDYLGDHGLGGKGSYYEAACHVPMIASHPALAGGQIRDDLVSLTDVTATMVGLAGAPVPSYMDATPLPGLGLEGESQRQHLIGILRSGWMIIEGTWKLARYQGGAHLFDLSRDPTEQHNRANDPACAGIYRRLDQALLSEVMRLLNEANFAGRHGTHSSSADFGRVGWQRQYPMPWGES